MGPNWQDVTISSGATESAEIDIPFGSMVVPPGRMTKADGTKFKGNVRPTFRIEESGTNSKIVLDAPAPEALVFKVKTKDEDD